MKKTWTILSLTLAMYGANSFGGSQGPVVQEDTGWTGFYIGANAGYIWSANNVIGNIGFPAYANPLFSPGSELVTGAIGRLGTHRIFNSLSGFIGGGQLGYNAQILDNLVIGIDAEFDGISNPSTTTNFVDTVTVPALGTYAANISVAKKLDYLGLLKGRLGVLLDPSLLVYGAGAFAYGGASFKTSYTVTSTLPVFLPMTDQVSVNNVLGGWAAGGGAEWLFAPCWSVSAEYIYYSLGPMHSYLYLNQNVATTPPTLYARTAVKSKAIFTGNTVRVGVNYHFG